jgi:hypothetical protein
MCLAGRGLARLLVPIGSTLDPLHLELDPLAKVTSIPEAGREKLQRLLRALCLHAPLVSTRHHHCGVVGLQFGFGHPFQRCYSPGALSR